MCPLWYAQQGDSGLFQTPRAPWEGCELENPWAKDLT